MNDLGSILIQQLQVELLREQLKLVKMQQEQLFPPPLSAASRDVQDLVNKLQDPEWVPPPHAFPASTLCRCREGEACLECF